MNGDDIFAGFSWHSCIGIDSVFPRTKFVERLPNTASALRMFVAAGNNLLIHKTTKCLWRLSKDGKSIEPVFGSDILTEDEVIEAMKGD